MNKINRMISSITIHPGTMGIDISSFTTTLVHWAEQRELHLLIRRQGPPDHQHIIFVRV